LGIHTHHSGQTHKKGKLKRRREGVCEGGRISDWNQKKEKIEVLNLIPQASGICGEKAKDTFFSLIVCRHVCTLILMLF
jgi:hypothetical protein